MSSIQLVVFDIAGTTVRDNGQVAEAFISAFGDFGFEMPLAEVKKVMGFRKIDSITLLLEKFAPEYMDDDILIDRIHTRFIDKMIDFYRNDEDLAPLPHAEEVFASLHSKGIRIALNTGFTRSITDTILHRLRWDNRHPYIDKVICSDEVTNGRPFPDMIQTLIADLGIASPDKVMKIGDTEVDVEEGRNANCGTVVSVTTGAYSRQQLEGYQPDFIIDDLRELLPIIEKA
ncbi:MAG TPA: HAD hydrolase-like protein [Puia sp.]|jgi:phosphonatase-like hydrolase|nr:HAD hydrolase-like protein [Puia sp.]